MIKRTLFFSNPYYLSFKQGQLLVTDKETGEIKKVSVEDLGFIVIEHPQVTFTQYLMARLIENNVAVVFCNEKHMPASMLLHLEMHHLQNEVFRKQIDATLPVKKNLWKQTVQMKIKNQLLLLEALGRDTGNLAALIPKVKSGDASNQEAAASRHYWSQLFDLDDFKRKRDGVPPNSLLNYGYAILRAAVARSLVGSGLLPTLGIHHRNKYNAFCLADDIMEPYRPFVDKTVVRITENEEAYGELTPDIKAELLKILTTDCYFKKHTKPLMVGLSNTTSSLSKCFGGESNKIDYPTICN
jgi:CRISPR-associated protein Cas1